MKRKFLALAGISLSSFFLKSGTLPAAPLPACPAPLSLIKPLGAQSVSLEAKADSITILSMNIQNIPLAQETTPNYSKNRMDCVNKLTEAFDVVALQEDFLSRAHPANKSFWQPAFNRPETLNLPLSNQPGLSFITALPFTPHSSAPYNYCSGFQNKGNDCLAQKGYQIADLDGIKIVNTHMDSGNALSDHEARSVQLTALSKALPKTGPLIVMGDMNVYYNNKADQQMLENFLHENNLRLVIRYSPQKGHDIVAIRDVTINWAAAVGPDNLSDHAGLAFSIKKPVKITTRVKLANTSKI